MGKINRENNGLHNGVKIFMKEHSYFHASALIFINLFYEINNKYVMRKSTNFHIKTCVHWNINAPSKGILTHYEATRKQNSKLQTN